MCLLPGHVLVRLIWGPEGGLPLRVPEPLCLISWRARCTAASFPVSFSRTRAHKGSLSLSCRGNHKGPGLDCGFGNATASRHRIRRLAKMGPVGQAGWLLPPSRHWLLQLECSIAVGKGKPNRHGHQPNPTPSAAAPPPPFKFHPWQTQPVRRAAPHEVTAKHHPRAHLMSLTAVMTTPPPKKTPSCFVLLLSPCFLPAPGSLALPSRVSL